MGMDGMDIRFGIICYSAGRQGSRSVLYFYRILSDDQTDVRENKAKTLENSGQIGSVFCDYRYYVFHFVLCVET